jgi:CheY-like chemotaxis protein
MTATTKRILCVDDDASTRDLLETLLGTFDLEAVAVNDAAAAMALVEHERFSLYIIDGQLPGLSGLEMCEMIRGRDRRTPIIVFSAHASAVSREAAMLAGADVYLVKPDTTEIVPTVERLLGEARAAGESRGEP